MRIVVAGSAASYAGAGQACSSYLVETDGTRLLIDCGNGSLANLAKVTDPLALDAIFVTHRHPDHFLDLFALQAAIRYAPSGPVPVRPVPLYAPAGLYESMSCLLDGRGKEDFHASFALQTIEPRRAIAVGDIEVMPAPVEHIPDTFALRVACDGKLLCYTSDSRFGDPVLDAASGADVLLCEATLPAEYAGRAPHMTAEEAGRVATQAGVGTLVLTHLWPTADRGELLAGARRTFGGEIVLAVEMLTVEVG
ncbi:MAG TPA: MBL fold metallo-hydrolase [Coriobacteriia bacterium]|jgi:ribonuclease BN (tRNA processing enzyme)